ncbi:MAG TPA: glycoside hydrolase family 3 N-terminal domain-containing protein [Actinomycetota bacterium]|nr:glycoside hydrolase family 3 N-terminal domain-containing protein [Actinomycetota bacterium]
MKRRLLPATLVVVLCGASTPALASTDGTVARMSLREKVGQLVMFSVAGTSLGSTERDVIERHHLGGVILFSHNYRDRDQLQRLTRQIRRAARRGNRQSIGALISVDQEGGPVKRFSDMPPHYSAPQMGAAEGTWLSWDQGKATGRALAANGVNVDLAPVADLDLPPNHVMRSRSFGSRPKKVGRRARSFARGLQARRVAASLKHFPGLGGADVNSDDGRAYVRRSRWQLHNVDAIPFRRAINGGARMVMLSHAIYVNDGGSRPASLNRYIATRRLRQEFGFEGVSISDALEPVSWKFGGDVPRTCKATIRAGVDIALITGRADVARRCAKKIRNAVRSGAISKRQLDRSVERIVSLKTWLKVGPRS